jgi:hypothetical protein
MKIFGSKFFKTHKKLNFLKKLNEKFWLIFKKHVQVFTAYG